MTIPESYFFALPLILYLKMTLQLTDLWKASFCKFSLNKIPKKYLKLYNSPKCLWRHIITSPYQMRSCSINYNSPRQPLKSCCCNTRKHKADPYHKEIYRNRKDTHNLTAFSASSIFLRREGSGSGKRTYWDASFCMTLYCSLQYLNVC